MALRAIEPAYRDELAVLYQGDVLDVLTTLPAGAIDAVVTDPPAGIAFMGRDWDTFPVRRRPAGPTFTDGRSRPGVTEGQEHRSGSRAAFVAWFTEVMIECRRVLRPGGHALVWAIPRTSHWTATAIEDAGLEVRDVVHHLFAQGFPKSLDVAQAVAGAAGAAGAEAAVRWRGWGTALKPAAEHWILARRPLTEPSVARNLVEHGAGALNIEACRVATAGSDSVGRWPANLVLSHAKDCRPAGTMQVRTGTAVRHRGAVGGRVYSLTAWGHRPGTPDMTYAETDGLETVEAWHCVEGCPVAELDRDSGWSVSRVGRPRVGASGGGWYMTASGAEHMDSGGASRFFYVAKASTADRNRGLVSGRNEHPTVKPVALMRWLVRLVTPPGGLVLDCFAGSGSTLVAAKLEGFRSIGVERDSDSIETCRRRLAWATHQPALLDAMDGSGRGPEGGEDA